MADKLFENNQCKYQRNHFAEEDEDNHDHIVSDSAHFHEFCFHFVFGIILIIQKILSHLESREAENSESQRKKKVVGRWTNREHEQFMTCKDPATSFRPQTVRTGLG